MSIATDTQNGVQAVTEESSRAALRAFSALSDYYLAAFDAGLKLQARAIETSKLLLDESASFQRANRKLAEELLQSARKTQQDVWDAVETNIGAAPAAWFPADKR